MSPRAHFYVAAFALTVMFTPLGMSILEEKQSESAYKLDNYKESLGRITEAKEVRRKRSGTTVYVTYQFQSNLGVTQKGEGTLSMEEWQQNLGEKPIRVYFDPSAPHRNVLAKVVDDYADERPLEIRLAVAALISAPLGVLVAAIWAWLVGRRSRRVQQ